MVMLKVPKGAPAVAERVNKMFRVAPEAMADVLFQINVSPEGKVDVVISRGFVAVSPLLVIFKIVCVLVPCVIDPQVTESGTLVSSAGVITVPEVGIESALMRASMTGDRRMVPNSVVTPIIARILLFNQITSNKL